MSDYAVKRLSNPANFEILHVIEEEFNAYFTIKQAAALLKVRNNEASYKDAIQSRETATSPYRYSYLVHFLEDMGMIEKYAKGTWKKTKLFSIKKVRDELRKRREKNEIT